MQAARLEQVDLKVLEEEAAEVVVSEPVEELAVRAEAVGTALAESVPGKQPVDHQSYIDLLVVETGLELVAPKPVSFDMSQRLCLDWRSGTEKVLLQAEETPAKVETRPVVEPEPAPGTPEMDFHLEWLAGMGPDNCLPEQPALMVLPVVQHREGLTEVVSIVLTTGFRPQHNPPATAA